MAERNKKTVEKENNIIWQHEDAVMKTMMSFFAEELLPYFKIEGKVISAAPTELVHMEMQKMNQDYNLVMEDGSWKHFEFQSRNEGLKGLKRFRVYEALTSYQHNVSVTTYVLYSGKIRKPMTEFTEGLNTYRVHPIIMMDKNSDELITQLQEKIKNGEILTKEELVPLALCPLMSGDMSQKQRIRSAFEITRNARISDPQTIQKIEAVIYAMADKFLESIDLEEIREEIKMTRFIQEWLNEELEQGFAQGMTQGMAQGMAQGIEQGMVQNRKDLVKKKLRKGLSTEEIADALEETVESVQELIGEIREEELK